MIDESELLAQLKKSSQLAFTTIYVNTHKDVYAFIFRYLHSSEAAKDILQSTFVKVWEIRSTIDINKNFRNLLLTIAKNYTLNYLRHKTIEYQRDPIYYESLIDSMSISEKLIHKQNIHEVILVAIDKLSPKKREVCRLKVMEGLSNAEIAERLGISINTVKVEYYQSIQKLKELLSNF